MAWVIDRDYLARDGEPTRVGTGQGTIHGRYRFRLRDEDGVVHYGGRYDEPAARDDESHGGLYEAWRFGMADTGATDLEVKREDAIRFGLMREEYADKYTRDGWTTIYA